MRRMHDIRRVRDRRPFHDRRQYGDRRRDRDRRHWPVPHRPAHPGAQRVEYGRPRPHFETPPSGAWYTGPGESYRYGEAPVAYGRDHTYDYHLGDRFGYGPDFYQGEARIRYWPRARKFRRVR